MADPKLLVVDDDAGVRRILREIFTRARYGVTEACDGAEALTRIRDQKYDLITMDLEMGRMDGVNAISVLKNETDSPVLVLSVHLTEANKTELESRGIDAWLDKPFATAELLAEAERLLSMGRK